MAQSKRSIDLLVLSDIHLGSIGCKSKPLVKYLKSNEPKRVILNGDIIDIWQFNKRFFPKSHLKVLKQFIRWASKGIPVTFIPGNHDELLRKFEGLTLGSLEIKNQEVVDLDGKKAWFFHGDVFDITMKNSKWLAKLGAVAYDLLILLNTFVNAVNRLFGIKPVSLSKKIKNSVKKAVKHINSFEEFAAEIAVRKGFDQVICGHIHTPEIKTISVGKNSIEYLNSGDWIENCTALEYKNNIWSIHYFDENQEDDTLSTELDNQLNLFDPTDLSLKEIFGNLNKQIMYN